MKSKLLNNFIFLSFLFVGAVQAEPTCEEVFTRIYQTAEWGTGETGECCSGSGSTVANTVSYRPFLQDFFNVYDIHSVVDAGCGDFGHLKALNWDGMDYVGYDVVKFLIQRDNKNYKAPNIRFVHGDILSTDLPPADLLICKDVLEHLSNEDVFQFLNQIKKYKYCLITNDVDVNTLSSTNPNCKRGSYRPLDLTQPPFNVKGVKSLTYGAYPYLKQALLIVNEGEFVTPLFPGE